MKNIQEIAFLGFTERIGRTPNVRLPHTGLNMINLRNEVINFMYPMNISSLFCVFAFHRITDTKKYCIKCMAVDNSKTIFSYNLDLTVQEVKTMSQESNNYSMQSSVIPMQTIWTIVPLKIPDGVAIVEPGEVIFTIAVGNEEYPIGNGYFHYAYSGPLTEERINAIKSNPNAAKFLKISIGCNHCNDEITAICGIEKKELKTNEIWYTDLPETYNCSCKTNTFTLKYLKEGMPHYLGNPFKSKSLDTSFDSLYKKKTINDVLDQYILLLDENPTEEEMQTFLSKNLILFHAFSPFKIILKGPILTKHITDFIILSQKGTLYLVEIEKPSKRIVKSGGGRTAEFNHPFDQVSDWLQVIKEHRNATLEMLDINPKEVTNIRGVVIVGRDNDNDEKSLRKIKSNDFGEIDFYTYDDIAGSMEALIRDFEEI